MWTWLSNLFNRLRAIFKSFIEAAIPAITQILLAEFKDYAIDIVTRLASMDLTNEDKRKEAFKAIKQESILRGKNLSDSLINLLLEIALQFIKNKI